MKGVSYERTSYSVNVNVQKGEERYILGSNITATGLAFAFNTLEQGLRVLLKDVHALLHGLRCEGGVNPKGV